MVESPMRIWTLICSAGLLLGCTVPLSAQEDGFTAIFNGKDLSGWEVPEGDGGHWKVVDGVIDYDARSEAEGDKNLWTEKEYGDFILRMDWRIKKTTGLYAMPVVLSDGSHLKDAAGNDLKILRPNADSGVYLRGMGKSQLNIWCWPVGSGEVYGYRMDKSMPPEVRAAVTPKLHADKDIAEWNTFEITMKGDRLWVKLNNVVVIENAQLPDIPLRGPLALQHHGGKRNGQWASPPALVQFRNIAV